MKPYPFKVPGDEAHVAMLGHDGCWYSNTYAWTHPDDRRNTFEDDVFVRWLSEREDA